MAGGWKEARDIVYNIINCSKPVVSAIKGGAAGAGLAVALLADIPIAARSAKIVDAPYQAWIAAAITPPLLPLLVRMFRQQCDGEPGARRTTLDRGDDRFWSN